MRKPTALALGILLFANLASSANRIFVSQQVSVDGVLVVRLTDSKRDLEVSILPPIGNIVCAMNVRGKNILFFPDVKLADFQKNRMQTGIPFLAL